MAIAKLPQQFIDDSVASIIGLQPAPLYLTQQRKVTL